MRSVWQSSSADSLRSQSFAICSLITRKLNIYRDRLIEHQLRINVTPFLIQPAAGNYHSSKSISPRSQWQELNFYARGTSAITFALELAGDAVKLEASCIEMSSLSERQTLTAAAGNYEF